MPDHPNPDNSKANHPTPGHPAASNPAAKKRGQKRSNMRGKDQRKSGKKACAPKRKRRWIKRLAWTVVGTGTTAGVALFVLTRPAVLTSWLQAKLTDRLGVPVLIDRVHIAGWDQLVVEGLSIETTSGPSHANALAEVERLTVDWDWSAMGPQAIYLKDPEIWLTEDLNRDRWLFEDLGVFKQTGQGETQMPKHWPVVEIQGGRIHRQAILGNTWTDLGDVLIATRIEPTVQTVSNQKGKPTQTRIDFAFDILPEQAAKSIELRGEIDPNAPAIKLTLSNLVYDASLRPLLPAKIAAFAQDHHVAGNIDHLIIQASQANQNITFDTSLVLSGGQVDLPYLDENVMLKDVDVDVAVNNGGLVVHRLQGNLGGIGYHIQGRMDGLDPESPLDVTLSTEPFVVQQGPNIFPLPDVPAVREVFERLNINANLQLQTHLVRENAGDAPIVTGSLTFLDGQAQPKMFAYPVDGLKGQLVFDENQILIDDLVCHGPSGAQWTITGTMGPLNEHMGFDIHVASDHLPIDEHLLHALPGSTGRFVQKRMVPAFGPPLVIERTESRLLINDERDHTVQLLSKVKLDGLAVDLSGVPGPVIAQGGWLTITRDGLWLDDVPVEGMAGATAKVSGRMSPLVSTGSGAVDHALDKLVPVPGLHGQVVSRQSKRGPWTASIDVTDVNLPIGPFTTNTLPDSVASALHTFNISGMATGQTFWQQPRPDTSTAWDFTKNEADVWVGQAAIADRITEGSWQHRIAGQLHGGRSQHVDGQAVAENLSLAFTSNRESTQLTDIQAAWLGSQWQGDLTLFHGESTSESDTGWVGHLQSLSDVTLNPETLGQLPPDLPGLSETLDWMKHNGVAIDARIDQLDFANEAGLPNASTPASAFAMHLSPSKLTANANGQSITTEQYEGSVAIDTQHVTLTDNRIVLPGATFAIDADWPLNEWGMATSQTQTVDAQTTQPAAKLTLTGQIDQWQEPVLALLPKALSKAVTEQRIQGPMAIERFELTQTKESQSFNGQLKAQGLQGQWLDQPFTDLKSQIDFAWIQPKGGKDPSQAKITLSDLSTNWAGRPIVDGQATMQPAPSQPSRWLLSPATAQVCQGFFQANGWCDTQAIGNNPATFGVDMTLDRALWAQLKSDGSDTPAQPVNQPQPQPQPQAQQNQPQKDNTPAPGIVSAQISVTGEPGKQATYLGQGRFAMDELKIAQNPFLMSLLSLANLALPGNEGFNQAEGRLSIAGETAHIEGLALRSPQVVLIGEGQANWHEQTLNLQVVPINPNLNYVPGITEFSQLIRGQLYQIRVQGPWKNLKTQVIPLPSVGGVLSNIGKLFGGKKDTANDTTNTPPSNTAPQSDPTPSPKR